MVYPDRRIRRAVRDDIPQIEDLGVEAYLQYRNQVPPVIYDAYRLELPEGRAAL